MLGGITLSTFTISRNFDNELRFPTGSIPLGIRQDCLNLYNLLHRFQNLVVTTLVEFPPLSGYIHIHIANTWLIMSPAYSILHALLTVECPSTACSRTALQVPFLVQQISGDFPQGKFICKISLTKEFLQPYYLELFPQVQQNAYLTPKQLVRPTKRHHLTLREAQLSPERRSYEGRGLTSTQDTARKGYIWQNVHEERDSVHRPNKQTLLTIPRL